MGCSKNQKERKIRLFLVYYIQLERSFIFQQTVYFVFLPLTSKITGSPTLPQRRVNHWVQSLKANISRRCPQEGIFDCSPTSGAVGPRQMKKESP